MKKWTKYEVDYIIKYNSIISINELSSNLNKTYGSVSSKLRSLKLREDKRKNKKYDNIVFSLDNKEDLYIMGFLWADGYLHDIKNRLELCISTDDFIDIGRLFDISKWAIYNRDRKNRKPQTTAGLYREDVCNTFRNTYNYTNKSLECPNFISEIPENKLHYFIRGFFDGDGCFYVSRDGKQKQCYLAGGYDQDWTWIEDILRDINVEYVIKKKIQRQTEKYSIIYIKRKSIKLIGDYIYNGFNIDGIGLSRKYKKFLKCLSIGEYREHQLDKLI